MQSLRGGGYPLPASLNRFFEPRFGADLSHVRLHTDNRAQEMARAVNAKAFTLGSDIVFGKGEYNPNTFEGKKLLGHEMTHVIQQSRQDRPIIRRTPAQKVSCGTDPLLDVDGKKVQNPLSVISSAEDSAKVMLNNAIEKIDFIRGEVERNDRLVKGYKIRKGVVFPRVEEAMRLMNMDPYDKAVWLGEGPGTASLLLERLRAIHGTLGRGKLFFHCLPDFIFTFCGQTRTNYDWCGDEFALSCPGTFEILFCKEFWYADGAEQAMTVIHEAAHNYYVDIGDEGHINNAWCYERLTGILNESALPGYTQAMCPTL